MLNAIIVNLGLFKNRNKPAPSIHTLSEHEECPLPLEVQSYDRQTLRVWIERENNNDFSLQLFCPSYQTEQSGRIELVAFGKTFQIDYQNQTSAFQVACDIAKKLDAWFDITLPVSRQRSQRVRLTMQLKTRPQTTASSTDGMVLVKTDGRGFDLEIGLDEPCAAGGVVTLSTAGQMTRYTTGQSEHGAEVVAALAKSLQKMGCIVAIRHLGCEDTYRARIDIMAVLQKSTAAQRATA